MRQHLGTVVRLAISLGLIAFVLYLYRDKLPAVAASLASANLLLVGVAVLLFWLAMTINGLKWWVLMRAQDIVVPFRAVLNFTFVGFFFNNLLPANIGGDVMRGYGLARYSDESAGAAASVVLDRIIGLSAYMSVAAVSALITVFVTGRSDLWILAIMAILVLAGLALFAATLISRRVRRLVGKLFTFPLLTAFAPIWNSLSQAFDAYRRRYASLALAFGIGLTGIATTSTVNFVLSESLGGGIPFLHILLFTPLIAMVLTIPISIGGLGLSQGVYPAFYSLVGVAPTHAFSLSVLVSAVQLFCSLPGGVAWLRWRKAPAQENDPGGAPSHA